MWVYFFLVPDATKYVWRGEVRESRVEISEKEGLASAGVAGTLEPLSTRGGIKSLGSEAGKPR